MLATGISIEEEIKDKMVKQMTSDEQLSYSFYTSRCQKAVEQRQQTYRELNFLTFLLDDQANRDNRNSYLRPKLNDDEVRINTGTIEKKCLTVVNEILNYNFEPEVVAYDTEDKEVLELGETFRDIIIRTNEQEIDDDLKFPALWDLATRRVMYMEEYWEEKTVVDKKKKKYDIEKGIVEFDKEEFKMRRPRKRLLDSRTIYLGDMNIPPHRQNDQPFIIKYDCKGYVEAKVLFGNYKNWKYVQAGKISTWYEGEFNWRFNSSLENDEVEIIYYYSFPDDEYQIIVNGVMMLDPGTPLPWEYEGYSIKVFVYREMEQNFALGQLFTVNAKVWAALKDEMLRLMVFKWRQLADPPSGIADNKVLSKDIYQPSARINGIQKDEIFPLLPNNQFSAGEQAIYQTIVNQVTEEVGVAALFQGQTEKGLTATQASDQLRQAIKSIGLLVQAWQRVVRDMSYLRIYNVIENGTDPLDTKLINGKAQKIYQSYTVKNTTLEKGLTGTKVIQFGKPTIGQDEAMLKAEEELAKTSKNVRFKLIDIEALRSVRLNWFINVLPKEKDSTALQKAMFKEEMNDAVMISQIAQRPLNGNTLVEGYERVWKRKNMFQEAPPQLSPLAPTGNPAVKQQAGSLADKIQSQMKQGVQNQVPKPSLNTLNGQV